MFFTPTDDFTHHAEFWGIPCYIKDEPPEGCVIAGTNLIYDLLILWVVPWAFWLTEYIRGVMDPWYEGAEGWPILVKGEIDKTGGGYRPR